MAGRIIDVAASDQCALALTADGRVIAWGLSDTGCRRMMPVELREGRVKASRIAASGNNLMAIVEGGRVVQREPCQCACYEDGGPKAALSGVTDIFPDGGRSLAIKGGALLAWGKVYCTLPAWATTQGTVCWAAFGREDLTLRLCNDRRHCLSAKNIAYGKPCSDKVPHGKYSHSMTVVNPSCPLVAILKNVCSFLVKQASDTTRCKSSREARSRLHWPRRDCSSAGL
jgi:hypothetical protein